MADRRDSDARRKVADPGGHVRIIPKSEESDRAFDWYDNDGKYDIQSGTGPFSWQEAYNNTTGVVSRSRGSSTKRKAGIQEATNRAKAKNDPKPPTKIDSSKTMLGKEIK